MAKPTVNILRRHLGWDVGAGPDRSAVVTMFDGKVTAVHEVRTPEPILNATRGADGVYVVQPEPDHG